MSDSNAFFCTAHGKGHVGDCCSKGGRDTCTSVGPYSSVEEAEQSEHAEIWHALGVPFEQDPGERGCLR